MSIIQTLHLCSRLACFRLCGRVVPQADIDEDYDRLSDGYDRHFSSFAATHARRMVARLAPARARRALDLAAGTGTVTLALAERVAPNGQVMACDRSAGMLSVARAKVEAAGISNVRFLHADMVDALAGLADTSLDCVTCAWALGYTAPREVLRLAFRKLRPGGVLGVIENARNTLRPVRQTALRVAASLPHHVVQWMDLHARLPRHPADLARLFTRAGFMTRDLWEGEESMTFGSGAEALGWVMKTGACAGFDRVMRPAVRQQCDALFVRYIEEEFLRDGAIHCTHRHVAGVAVKEG